MKYMCEVCEGVFDNPLKAESCEKSCRAAAASNCTHTWYYSTFGFGIMRKCVKCDVEQEKWACDICGDGVARRSCSDCGVPICDDCSWDDNTRCAACSDRRDLAEEREVTK